MRTLGVIPAHLESQRLPRKLLLPICGRPMLAWVYEHARAARCLGALLVATDSTEILEYCRGADIPAVMTSAAHRSGTDRIVEVMSREKADIYVNIQGDEPMVTAEHIEFLMRPFESGQAGQVGMRSGRMQFQVSTLKVAISREEARNPNNVKVVTDHEAIALYFSRAMIPYDRDGDGKVRYFKHLGLYAYTAAALEKFHKFPPSALEQIERLEQLRFLENGVPIVVVETRQNTIGVDTEEDLKKVETYFDQSGRAGDGSREAPDH